MKTIFNVIKNENDPEFIKIEDGQIISTEDMIPTGMSMHECADYHQDRKAVVYYHPGEKGITCDECGAILE